ncbi:RNA-binding transcriptional accessory protein [Paraglaciecola aquimarina]|uniref:RNA-binding transcriptional accessory protein n=1 Tax=Paraglaciecola algarum TaxID=3050085 RepID=A0ABS9DBG4_9ALTE|nr:Tex family protein [Paraglaciecola sp. G1-23]MCF2950298.1 RNA-binding transcriptional accessory protein [Paraglaciecola sp. G1-23]
MIIETIAQELKVKAHQVKAAVTLLDEGSTVPFIARYRKEATDGLDDVSLRKLEQRLTYLRDLEDRRKVIIKSIQDQEKLTPELKSRLLAVDNKTELEDIYLPFKPKRRTKGQIAIEAGLEPLADALFNNPELDPEHEANAFISESIVDTKTALDGAKYILMERFAEDADLLQKIRQYLNQNAHIKSQVVAGKEKEGEKFKDYFDHTELLKKVPSHRALAMFRGRNENILQVSLDADPEKEEGNRNSYCEHIIAQHLNLTFNDKPADKWLASVVQWTWRIKIHLHMESELFGTIREQAEQDAINVFAKNLNDLLMAAPAGPKVTMGLDPGLRTGVKVAIVDATGKVLATSTIFPHVPQNQWDKSSRTIATLCKQHKVQLISIGNGTGSRETDKLAGEVIKNNPELSLKKIVVSEAGASVYSASELASEELPDMDVSLRGAVSIARRLQDPLAELVKIEPKAIGVGQYQHDVSQSNLGKSLSAVIEDCVNAVGVDINTASSALLSHVSGLNRTLANNIVNFRDKNGAFSSRKTLKEVERLGPKAFEQAAGFLRIMDGENPLDASAVHPEAYPVVNSIIKKSELAVNDIVGNSEILKQLKPDDFVTEQFGLPTVCDIISELDKPGRDPRPEFKTANFKEDVQSLSDLKVGMILEGVVSNVANFGAFVDVGVHQDGLVHISAMTDKFISDPREIVKAGDIVKVKVMEVDAPRKRVSFTMRLGDSPNQSANNKTKARVEHKKERTQQAKQHNRSSAPKQTNQMMGNAFADAFAKAKK